MWFSLLAIWFCFGTVSFASDALPVFFFDIEDRTALGYNTSMNFWYVGGEVAFLSSPLDLAPLAPGETCFLTVQVKSPVTDAVSVIVRITDKTGTHEHQSDLPAKPGVVRFVAFDLSKYVGQTILVELAYSWEQSSLVTVIHLPPFAEITYNLNPRPSVYRVVLKDMATEILPVLRILDPHIGALTTKER